MRAERYFPIVMAWRVFLPITAGKAAFNTSQNDASGCRLSQSGVEYRGFLATTVGGVRCQSWSAEEPLHKISADIIDADFPEKSMKDAKNYCRNPTADPRGPWCYTLDPALIDDECDVPLCTYQDCIITGAGAEYGGKRTFGSSKRKCKSWNRKHKLRNGKSVKFSDKNFPGGSRAKASNYCRNPDDDTGGPWCYVEESSYEFVEKEYCDIPFCDDKDCLVYTGNSSIYSTLTRFNSSHGNVSLWIKLWSPLDEQNAEARILLSSLPIPTSSEKIAQDWKIGVELMISNSVSGQIYPMTDNERFLEVTPGTLSSSKWTGLWITWAGGFVSVGIDGVPKPLFTNEYKTRNTIMGIRPDTFLYYGLAGTGMLWSMEFCEKYCESHTTFGLDFSRIWPVQQNNDTQDVRFYVRASRNVAVRLFQSPGMLFPCFTVEIGRNDVVSLLYQENDNSIKQNLKEVGIKHLLNYWDWREFTISIFGTHLRLFSQRPYGNEEILYANHHLLITLRWFSVGSDRTIAHWTLFCSPDATSTIEKPHPPNCIHSTADYQYAGDQWTSAGELPCVPWIAKEVPDHDKIAERFAERSVVKALNRCRNPSRDPGGAYCYAISTPEATEAAKQYCPVRRCRSLECRMAGTANDYIGTLSTTRSGRVCAKWMSDYEMEKMRRSNVSSTTTETYVSAMGNRMRSPRERRATERNVLSSNDEKSTTEPPSWSEFAAVKPVHLVDRIYLNDSLYPERNVINASNYCRDPSRNIAGTWCYTTDPLVPQDLCDVRDCEKPEECTFLVKGHGIGRRLYILPEYRTEGLSFSLKSWEPDRPDSITFVFTADDGLRSRYILKIGALDNEKVLLYYQSEDNDIVLLKKKTLPHLLYHGKWSGFVLRISRGHVLVYYEGASSPLFEWQHPVPAEAFLPVYYYYNSEQGHAIGVAFDCASRCHIEHTQTDRYTRILPISVWSREEVVRPDRLVLMIRAEGVVSVPLLLLPATSGFYALAFDERGRWISLLKNTHPKVRIYHKQRVSRAIFTANSWTNVTIKWTAKRIDVFHNGSNTFRYTHRRPLLFYFFSLAVNPGSWAIWSANCVPTDIDGPPLDGGWSEWGPWTCSASCNGGIGTRKRYCNSPEPNVRGEPCVGPGSMTGRCNIIPCGDITDDTVTLIKRGIQQKHTSLIVKEHESTSLSADRNIVDSIRVESSDSEIQWSRNGIFLQDEPPRLTIGDYDIAIRRATPNDSGVYTLTVHRIDDTYMVINVVTLAVLPIKDSTVIRETLPLHVFCHCVVLGYIYSDLKVYWTIDDKVWRDYGVTLPVAVNIDRVPAVNRSHRGTWKCIVEQVDLNFRWTTNALRVRVLGPPNWRTHLMEDKLTRPIFGWMPSEIFVAYAALFMTLFLISCVIIGTVCYVRLSDDWRVKTTVSRKKTQDEVFRTEDRENDVEDPRDGTRNSGWKVKRLGGTLKEGRSRGRKSAGINGSRLMEGWSKSARKAKKLGGRSGKGRSARDESAERTNLITKSDN